MGKTFKGQGALAKAMDALVAASIVKDQAAIRKLAKLFAEEAKAMIYARTKAGKAVGSYNGGESPLKKLSPSYIRRRQTFAGLHPTTSPGKSNLTRTGQMLESLAVEEMPGGKFFVVVRGTRKGGGSNAEVAQWVTEQGRPFLNLSRRQLDKLIVSYRKNFASLVKSGKAR